MAECVKKIKKVKDWFEKQTQLAFFASSLLIVYEGNPDHAKQTNNNVQTKPTEDNGKEHSATSSNSRTDPASLVDVRMIDFAHVFPAESKDENYLYGLNNLIKYLEELCNDNWLHLLTTYNSHCPKP